MCVYYMPICLYAYMLIYILYTPYYILYILYTNTIHYTLYKHTYIREAPVESLDYLWTMLTNITSFPAFSDRYVLNPPPLYDKHL
jgi:hypothetical protein